MADHWLTRVLAARTEEELRQLKQQLADANPDDPEVCDAAEMVEQSLQAFAPPWWDEPAG